MISLKVGYDFGWEMEVEYDPSPSTIASMKEQLLFWMSGEDRIKATDDDIVEAYMKLLAEHAILLSMDYNVHGIEIELGASEGWCKFDDNSGIRIKSVDTWEFGTRDFYINNPLD